MSWHDKCNEHLLIVLELTFLNCSSLLPNNESAQIVDTLLFSASLLTVSTLHTLHFVSQETPHMGGWRRISTFSETAHLRDGKKYARYIVDGCTKRVLSRFPNSCDRLFIQFCPMRRTLLLIEYTTCWTIIRLFIPRIISFFSSWHDTRQISPPSHCWTAPRRLSLLSCSDVFRKGSSRRVTSRRLSENSHKFCTKIDSGAPISKLRDVVRSRSPAPECNFRDCMGYDAHTKRVTAR